MANNASDAVKRNDAEEGDLITFRFRPNGDLASVLGNASIAELLIIAFEATMIAQAQRIALMGVQMREATEIADIRRKLTAERH